MTASWGRVLEAFPPTGKRSPLVPESFRVVVSRPAFQLAEGTLCRLLELRGVGSALQAAFTHKQSGRICG